MENISLLFAFIYFVYLWHCGIVVITTAQDSMIRNGDDLWQWSRLKMSLNTLSPVNHTTKKVHHLLKNKRQLSVAVQWKDFPKNSYKAFVGRSKENTGERKKQEPTSRYRIKYDILIKAFLEIFYDTFWLSLLQKTFGWLLLEKKATY